MSPAFEGAGDDILIVGEIVEMFAEYRNGREMREAIEAREMQRGG